MAVLLEPAVAVAHHLLVLGDDVLPAELGALATSRFVAARWEREPARPGTKDRAWEPGVLRLSRVSVLEGPYLLGADLRGAFALPSTAAQVYLMRGPRERGEPPWPAAGDKDGIGRAFADGLPIRDEERVVDWLVAAARRLGGAVRAAGSGIVLVPEPEAAVDRTVWSDVWLDPRAAESVTRSAVPGARLDLGADWGGPPTGTGRVAAYGAEDMEPIARAVLHTAADAYDQQILAGDLPRDAYGLVADLGMDGLLAVSVTGEEEVPLVLRDAPWAARGAIAYRVSWEPEDLAELGMEHPPIEHRVARRRAGPLVVAVAAALLAAVGGQVTDPMGFLADP